MDLAEYEKLQPNIKTDEGLLFFTPNTHCAWRVETLLTKEPDTIAWIQKMKPGEILFDIGANMGQYSLYAAKRGIKVHAFEPESQNFALLCKNVAVNKLDTTTWPLAMSDKPGLCNFHVNSLMPGGSCNSLRESVDYMLQEKNYAFKQGCYATTIDEFSNLFGFPNHIKIDVDGLEHKIIVGASKTLPKIKSILIEINTHLQQHRDLVQEMTNLGFEYDQSQADEARRKDGPFQGVGNIIFYKN